MEYDRLDRIRTFCENGATGGACQSFHYVGDSDWLSYVSQSNTVLQRYLYANGRPLRMDDLGRYQQPSYYYRYNARGDAANFVKPDGYSAFESGNSPVMVWHTFGAWGDANYRTSYLLRTRAKWV